MRAIVSRESQLFALAVELYLRHQPGADGLRIRCDVPGCIVRQRAAYVMAAAGVDPALYDPAPRRPEAAPWAAEPTATLPAYRGGKPS
jgi:hypothetical protein